MSEIDHQLRSTIVDNHIINQRNDDEINSVLSDSFQPVKGESVKKEEEKEIYLVKFDEKHDPDNPVFWTLWKKWKILCIISSSSTCVTFTSSIVTTAYEGIQKDLKISHEVAILGLSLFVLGTGSGPLLLSPFSEFYGRRPIYIISLLAFFLLGFPVAFTNNAPVFFIFRFFTGVAGSAFLSVAGGTISDLFTVSDSFFPMSFYTLSPFLGPILGPVCSGFIVQFSSSWRWNFRLILIWSFIQLLLIVCFAPETYPKKRLIIKAQRLRKETGNSNYYTQHEKELNQRSLINTIAISGSKVFLLLLLEPMLFLLCFWCAIMLGIIYLFFEFFPIVFAKHNFQLYQDGLTFLGLGVGIIIGCGMMYGFSQRYKRQSLELAAQQNCIENGVGKPIQPPPPELRLDAAKLGSILSPIGLFIFAFTSYKQIHWIAPIIASIPIGTGFMLIFTSVFTFTTDNWRPVAASAMGANSVLRSFFGAAFPLFAQSMANKLTTTGAAALLAGLNVLIIPLPFIFSHYGPQLRAKSKFAMSE